MPKPMTAHFWHTLLGESMPQHKNGRTSSTGLKPVAPVRQNLVDSWVLANWFVGGHTKPDFERVTCITPFQWKRRQLHKLQESTGGIRKREGSTNSLGFKRGSLVKHIRVGLAYVGGFTKDRISLHSVQTGERLGQN